MAPLVTLLALVASLTASVAAVPRVRAPAARTHHAPEHISADWKQVGNADSSASIEFTFVLEGDYDGLTEKMEKIAAEHSAWLTEEELATFVAPSDDAKTVVEAAIKELGATKIATSTAGDKVTVSTTVEKASKVD